MEIVNTGSKNAATAAGMCGMGNGVRGKATHPTFGVAQMIALIERGCGCWQPEMFAPRSYGLLASRALAKLGVG